MGFEKNNTYGKGRVKGSKNKATIFKENLDLLKDIGVTPIATSKDLINDLLNDKELKNSEKLNLLTTFVNRGVKIGSFS